MTRSRFTESTVEHAALTWLESLDWRVAHGPDIAPDLSKTKLAAGAKVPLRPALPFPRLLLFLPDRVQTPRNTSAISL